MLHRGTRCQNLGYIAARTFRLVCKISWKACKLFAIVFSFVFVHLLRF